MGAYILYAPIGNGSRRLFVSVLDLKIGLAFLGLKTWPASLPEPKATLIPQTTQPYARHPTWTHTSGSCFPFTKKKT